MKSNCEFTFGRRLPMVQKLGHKTRRCMGAKLYAALAGGMSQICIHGPSPCLP